MGAFLVVGMLLSAVWSVGLLASKAVKLLSVGSGALLCKSVFCFGAAVAGVEAVCAVVGVSKSTVSVCSGCCATGGLGADFFVAGEAEGEEAASGDTGGLFLAF